jgi:hypothetical protein
MTYRPEPDTDSPTGRRIEVTQKMVGAGEAALARFNPDLDPYSVGVERILHAALEAGGYTLTEI